MRRYYQQIVREVAHHLSYGTNICASAFINLDKCPTFVQHLYRGLNFRRWCCAGVNEDDNTCTCVPGCSAANPLMMAIPRSGYSKRCVDGKSLNANPNGSF